jgi:hypothetical protein
MTPEDKARRLFADMRYRSPGTTAGRVLAKDHSVFCCNEVIAEIEDLQQNCSMEFPMALAYWNEVKKHIENIVTD